MPAGTSIDSDLAAECFSGPPKGFSQGKISWEFEKHGRDQLLIVSDLLSLLLGVMVFIGWRIL